MIKKSRLIPLTAILTSLSIVLRLIKHAAVGGIQFINLIAVITFITAIILGPYSSMFVGFFSFIISDFFIGLPGPWSITNGVILGLLSIIPSLLWHKNERKPEYLELVIVVFILEFIYDLFSSFFGLIIWSGLPIHEGLILSLAGLFFPVMGGFIFLIGPITELTTSVLVGYLYPKIVNIIGEMNLNVNK
ncbi:MAG: hypothetical protein ACTSUV_02550 [Candidatus Ranarchaeia archaeon]